MTVRLTYFVHGTTTDNEQGISSGWNDVRLSELGRQQSKQLTVLTTAMRFDVVITSDLLRAVESAELTWGDTYLRLQDARLRECNYGDLNGELSSIVEPLQESAIHDPMPNGESYEMVKARVADFLEFLQANYDGKQVAVVAHKAPQLALDVLLKHVSWEQAFASDWRRNNAWQPGWEYTID